LPNNRSRNVSILGYTASLAKRHVVASVFLHGFLTFGSTFLADSILSLQSLMRAIMANACFNFQKQRRFP